VKEGKEKKGKGKYTRVRIFRLTSDLSFCQSRDFLITAMHSRRRGHLFLLFWRAYRTCHGCVCKIVSFRECDWRRINVQNPAERTSLFYKPMTDSSVIPSLELEFLDFCLYLRIDEYTCVGSFSLLLPVALLLPLLQGKVRESAIKYGIH